MRYDKLFLSLSFIVLFSFFSCKEKPDIEKEKLSVLNADKEFSDYSVKKGQIKAFIDYADENATLLRPNSMPIVGKNEIEKLYDGKNDDSYTLTWTPLFAEVGMSADIGYTYGTWLFKTRDKEGKEISSEGTYVTVWEKQTDGKWKWVLDTGNDGLKKPEVTNK
ncbi:MAG TPA: DUF4440 domain-containing protein [Bacteroidales bacterium]|nr:DUF4440 domain-containing protein [Bacteroidales bacterium]HPS18009.1 DUF4440 domain-containing protein [Bacteroidales bacterium]